MTAYLWSRDDTWPSQKPSLKQSKLWKVFNENAVSV